MERAENIFERVLRNPPEIPAAVVAEWERRGLLTPPSTSMPTTVSAALVKRLVDHPSTAQVTAEIAAAEQKPEPRRSSELRVLEPRLRDAILRDELAKDRPEGCWCLGGGSRMRGRREFCGCPDGVAAEAEALRAEEERLRREHQRKVELYIERAEIPRRFWNVTLDTFPVTAKTQSALDRVREWAETDPYDFTENESLFLYGPFGTGKTGLAVGALKRQIEGESSGLFITVPSLLERIRRSYDRSTDEDQDLFERVQNVEVLVLDDIGAEKPSEWVVEKLFTLINTRHDEMRSTIFTSNLTPSELAKHIGERIAWRIVEMCAVVQISGMNLRDKR